MGLAAQRIFSLHCSTQDPSVTAYETLFPGQELNSGPLHWELRVLALDHHRSPSLRLMSNQQQFWSAPPKHTQKYDSFLPYLPRLPDQTRGYCQSLLQSPVFPGPFSPFSLQQLSHLLKTFTRSRQHPTPTALPSQPLGRGHVGRSASPV